MPDNKRHAPRGVIFDLDGTLVDTLDDIAQAVNAARVAHALPALDPEEYRERVGWGLRELVRRSFPAESIADPIAWDALVEETRAAYHARPADHVTAYPGIEKLVADLAARGVALGVLSNKPDALTQAAMEATILRSTGHHAFFAIQGQIEGVPAKPDPTALQVMLARMGLKASECAYVGDSEIDIDTARRSGCMAVTVTWGFRDRPSLVSADPDILCDTIQQLREALGLPKESTQ